MIKSKKKNGGKQPTTFKENKESTKLKMDHNGKTISKTFSNNTGAITENNKNEI